MGCQPVQPGGDARRLPAQGLHVTDDARNDAADEADEQQQVDRREPHRGVDVVHPQRPVDTIQGGVVGGKVGDLDRAVCGLRHHRPRDGCQGQQEQQDEGRPHARQLTPQPPHGCAETESAAPTSRGRAPRVRHFRVLHGITHQITAPNLAAQVLSIAIIDSHHPVTNSTPMAIMSTPPTRCTTCWWARTASTVRPIHTRAAAAAMNGIPSPNE